MQSNQYYEIDNFGQGNCAYYAYAISLMYFLRNQTDNTIANTIFKERLKLSEQNIKQLLSYIDVSRKQKQVFNTTEINQLQTILGPKLRETAANRVALEIQDNPTGTQAYTVIRYYMDNAIRAIPKYPQNNAIPHDVVTSNILNIQKFKEQLALFVDQKKGDLEYLTEDTLDDAITQLTSDFLQNTFRTTYTDSIKTNGIWESEDVICALHRAICNEKKVRDESSEQVEFISDINIELAFANNGVLRAVSGQIILHNSGNTHWTSLMPEAYLTDLNTTPDSPKVVKRNLSPFDSVSLTENTNTSEVTFTAEELQQQIRLYEYYEHKNSTLHRVTDRPKDANAKVEAQPERIFYISQGDKEKLQSEIENLLSTQTQLKEEIKQFKDKKPKVDISTFLELTIIERKLLVNEFTVQHLLAIQEAEKNLIAQQAKDALVTFDASANAAASDFFEPLPPSKNPSEDVHTTVPAPPSNNREPFESPTNQNQTFFSFDVLIIIAQNTALTALCLLASVAVCALCLSTGILIPAALVIGAATFVVSTPIALGFFNSKSRPVDGASHPLANARG